MKELDLHGMFHHEVEDIVENFVLLYARELPLRIITGYSDIMKSKVMEVLERHNFGYDLPAHNGGEIIVLWDKG